MIGVAIGIFIGAWLVRRWSTLRTRKLDADMKDFRTWQRRKLPAVWRDPK